MLVRATSESIEPLCPSSESSGTSARLVPNTGQDGLLLHENLFYIPHDDELRVETMQTHYDNLIADHYGVAKTLKLLTRNYYFPNMHSYMSRNMLRHAIYVHAASRQGTSSTTSLHHSLFHQAHERTYPAILSSISQYLMSTYLSTDLPRCVMLYLATRPPRLPNSPRCF